MAVVTERSGPRHLALTAAIAQPDVRAVAHQARPAGRVTAARAFLRLCDGVRPWSDP
jgi:hypothetical protein